MLWTTAPRRTLLSRAPRTPTAAAATRPEAAFFDEAGFLDGEFWWKFAYPPAGPARGDARRPHPLNGFFAAFLDQIKRANADGDRFFFLENHSLSCSACVENNEAERCCHNLSYIPLEVPLLRFTSLRTLVPANEQSTFRAEVYGVLADEGVLLPSLWTRWPRARARSPPTGAVFVGIDPANHSRSEMGLCAYYGGELGVKVLAGLATVPVAERRLERDRPDQGLPAPRASATSFRAPLVPVVEVNSSEVFALSITKAFDEFPHLMPLTSSNFKVNVCDGIGVRTTEQTKQCSVQQLYVRLLEGRLVLHQKAVTVSPGDIIPRGKRSSIDDALAELVAQLKRVRDDPDTGEITGKTSSGQNDDLAMAVMIAVLWATSLASLEAQRVKNSKNSPLEEQPRPRAGGQGHARLQRACAIVRRVRHEALHPPCCKPHGQRLHPWVLLLQACAAMVRKLKELNMRFRDLV